MELVAGSYEQVLFGFTVQRGPAKSGHQEVRQREPRGCGGQAGWSFRGRTVEVVVYRWFSMGLGWRTLLENGQVYAANPSSREVEAGGE